MTSLQRYIFSRTLRSVLLILGGLTLLAILAQGLQYTDLIIENRQSALKYFTVILLGAPQVMALLTPIALFVATVWALNQLHRDNELVVAQAAGVTAWQLASPVVRLAILAALLHLVVNLFVQPMAQREMREQIRGSEADIAATLVRPGQFTSAGRDVTVYARDRDGEYFQGVLISDQSAEPATDYLARLGTFVSIDGMPALRLIDAQAQQLDNQGALSTLDFDEYIYSLAGYFGDMSRVELKPSDLFLHELMYFDRTSYTQVRDRDRRLAEAHARMTTPLLSPAMVMIALIAVLGGSFSRRGYSRRIIWGGFAAFGLLGIQLSAQSAAAGAPALNALQWIVPMAAMAVTGLLYFNRGRRLRPSARAGFGFRQRAALKGAG